MMASKNQTFSDVSKDLTAELQVLNANLTSRLSAIDDRIDHETILMQQTLKPVEQSVDDHEQRIRDLETALGALKVKYDLMTSGSFAASIIAFIKTFWGIG